MFNLSVMFAPFPEANNGLQKESDVKEIPENTINRRRTDGFGIVSGSEPGVEELNGAVGKNSTELNSAVEENYETTIKGDIKDIDAIKDLVAHGPKKQTRKGSKKKAFQIRNKKRNPGNYKGKSGGHSSHETQNNIEQITTSCNDMEPHKQQVNEQSQGQRLEDIGSNIDCEQNRPTEPQDKKFDKLTYEANEKPYVSVKKTDNAYAMTYVIANRSASLFFLHLYKECVADIDLAFKLGYPDELAYKLHDRKGKCLVQLGQGQEAIVSFQKATMCVADAKLDENGKQKAIFSLSEQIKDNKKGKDKIKAQTKEMKSTMDGIPVFTGKRSPKFGCTSTTFEMAVSDTRGRHVIAGEDVAVAEMVTCEEPYSSVLYPEYYTTHCNR